VRSLATFIGALFIVEGVTMSLTTGIDRRVGRANIVSGLLSVPVGIAIIAWPKPGLLAVAIFLGAWLIVIGTLTIAESLAARKLISSWWLWLITGLLEIPSACSRSLTPARHWRRSSPLAGSGPLRSVSPESTCRSRSSACRRMSTRRTRRRPTARALRALRVSRGSWP
jgi:Short repeat of unknown function (DUF308)